VHLVVVGGAGWRTESEEQEIESLGLSGRVHFAGYVPQADLTAIYNAAAVFVFPSLHEGFGLAALEALACGTPVVCSNTASLPEVTGDAALLVDPQDHGAIAAAIARLLDEPELSQLLGRAGVERAQSFTWEACARQTIEVYRRVLGE
jgi:glycosyltransferase involved in cell wall biosynthesis